MTPFLSDLVPIACEIVLPRGNDLLRKSRESFGINQYDSAFLELIPESKVLLIAIVIFPCNSVRIGREKQNFCAVRYTMRGLFLSWSQLSSQA